MKTIPIPFKQVPSLDDIRSGFPSVNALFFDMDGTIFNSEAIHADAMLMMAAKYKIRPPYSPETVHALMIGKADHLVFELIKDWDGVPQDWTAENFISEKNANVIERLRSTPLASYFHPSVSQLLTSARQASFYLALITSSEKIVTEELLRIAGLGNFFELVLTRDDCPLHKPDPWPYNEARSLSGKARHEVLIFEDSHVGLEAATSSGAHVIKVEWY